MKSLVSGSITGSGVCVSQSIIELAKARPRLFLKSLTTRTALICISPWCGQQNTSCSYTWSLLGASSPRIHRQDITFKRPAESSPRPSDVLNFEPVAILWVKRTRNKERPPTSPIALVEKFASLPAKSAKLETRSSSLACFMGFFIGNQGLYHQITSNNWVFPIDLSH